MAPVGKRPRSIQQQPGGRLCCRGWRNGWMRIRCTAKRMEKRRSCCWAERTLRVARAGRAVLRTSTKTPTCVRCRHLGDWRRAAAVLFEPESLRGDSPPSREAGEVAPTIPSRSTAGGGLGTDFDCDGGLRVADAIAIQERAVAENPSSGPDGAGFREGVAYTLEARIQVQAVAHTLRGEGFDASEDGTGRGTPLVPVSPCLDANFAKHYGQDNQHIDGGDGLFVLSSGQANAELTYNLSPALNCNRDGAPIAFSSKDHGGDAMAECSPTLRVGGHDGSHANAGVPPAVAFQPRYARNGQGAPDTIAAPLMAQAGETGKGDSAQCAASPGMAVRRLTPRECCRLQQFPDDYLDLKYANADEAHAAQILHTLWREVGAKGIAAEEAHFKDDGQDDLCEKRRIAASLFTPQILLAGVHVGWIQWTQAWRSAERQNLSHVGQAGWSEGFVRGLRDAWESRRSPYQRESFGQLARELGVALQELPLTTTQAGEALRRYRLWPEAQGAWPLRYALATEAQAASGKPLTPDGPRYKALGNSMAVPVMRWIGERIQAIAEQRTAA
jgi:hypothetical protein